jgi:uncharacterized membrane protein YbhN (UPF0104 family)
VSLPPSPVRLRASPDGGGGPAPRQAPKRPWWPWLQRALTLAFFALIAVFSIRYARGVDWAQVWAAIVGTPARVLAGAAALAALSHGLYSCFDLLGRHYTGHRLPPRRVMQVTFVSYAFNLNMGSLVGGVAFRFRLYSRLGLDKATITRVLTLSMLTNWLGYLVLAGAVFSLAPLPLPPDWKLDSGGLRWLGIALLATAAAYIALCLFSKRRSFSLRGHELLLPRPRMVAVQLALSITNWSVIGALLYLLLGGQVSYPSVLSVLLVAAVAGVITHVPAGLGVLEAVFIALLSHRVPEGPLLGALLSYRALYYIAPLLIASALYLVLEARGRRVAAG